MVEPTTLQMPITVAPFLLASLIAARVSAVSPDCEIAITTVLGVIIGSLYLNSEAYSTSTGILAYSSIMYSPMRALCQLVPHATMNILSALISDL